MRNLLILILTNVLALTAHAGSPEISSTDKVKAIGFQSLGLVGNGAVALGGMLLIALPTGISQVGGTILVAKSAGDAAVRVKNIYRILAKDEIPTSNSAISYITYKIIEKKPMEGTQKDIIIATAEIADGTVNLMSGIGAAGLSLKFSMGTTYSNTGFTAAGALFATGTSQFAGSILSPTTARQEKGNWDDSKKSNFRLSDHQTTGRP